MQDLVNLAVVAVLRVAARPSRFRLIGQPWKPITELEEILPCVTLLASHNTYVGLIRTQKLV